MISEHTIHTYVAQNESRGWHAAARGSLSSGWHLVFDSKLTRHDVYLDVRGDWVYLQCPMLKLEPARNCRETLLEYLLRLNDRMFMAKFTLIRARPQRNAVNWVVLVSECPVDDFDGGMFRLMTEAIAVYVDRYFREILSIAREEPVAELVREASLFASSELSQVTSLDGTAH